MNSALENHHSSILNDSYTARRTASKKSLTIALIINFVFLIVEVIGGFLTNSLALLADAGHMLSDVTALALSLFVLQLAGRPATERRTFGLLRAEVVGAFINGGTLFLIVGLIFWEAWQRLGQVHEIDGPLMLVVAVLGLLANLFSALILAKSREGDLNVQGAFLHMMADALGSVGVIIAGLVIWFTGWAPIDLLVSVIIGLLILWSTFEFFRETMDILLEATPKGVDYNEVKKALENIDHVDEVHDLHIWTITTGMPILTAHLVMTDHCCNTNHWPVCIAEAKDMVRNRFGIDHTTLEVEMCGGASECGRVCKFVRNGNNNNE